MKHFLRRTIGVGAVVLIVLAAGAPVGDAAAQDAGTHKSRNGKTAPPPPPAAAAQPQKLPPRAPFTAADEAVADVPGMPDARFWADSETDFAKALPPQRGPWLVLSTGGSDGAFGAGLLNGLTAAGKRPDYALVTGVSTGALMAPFVFAGPRYDAALAAVFTHTSAADIFEVGGTGESFLDTWPLKDLIAKQITPALLTDIAAAHRAGRRLFIVTTDLDAGRSVVWNMGAIAVHFTTQGAGNGGGNGPGHGGDAAIKLFRDIMLASGSVPGAFPPVLIDVEGNGKRFAEMHADGGVGGQFFMTPPALMQSTSGYKIPADALYIVVNSGLQPEFQVVERNTPTILAQTVSMAIKADIRVLLDRAYVAAKNSGIGFNVATIPPSFNAPSRGAFDPDYMKALFNVGYDQGKSATPFAGEPPAFPAPPANGMSDPQPGANR